MRSILLICLAAISAVGCTPMRGSWTLADGGNAMARGDTQQALAIFESIRRDRPDSTEAAIAADATIEITNQRLFPEKAYNCSAEAVQQYIAAESEFRRNALDPALRLYQRASELCPENATWWVHAGDAFFGAGEFEQAKSLYTRGLELDPWNRSGHRFLSDAETKTGNEPEAYRHAVLAVISDPTYETGWHQLKATTINLHGQWQRPTDVKPIVRVDEDEKPNIVLRGHYTPQAAMVAWIAYALKRFAADKPNPAKEPQEPDAESPTSFPTPEEWERLSAIERERALVTFALDAYHKFAASHPGETSLTWETISNAKQAGFLDEAIYMHLIDRELAASFVEYRAANIGRLVEYVTRFVAPVAPAGSDKI